MRFAPIRGEPQRLLSVDDILPNDVWCKEGHVEHLLDGTLRGAVRRGRLSYGLTGLIHVPFRTTSCALLLGHNTK